MTALQAFEKFIESIDSRYVYKHTGMYDTVHYVISNPSNGIRFLVGFNDDGSLSYFDMEGVE